MAVQAQYPTNVLLPDLRNRTRQVLTGENRNFLTGPAYGVTTLEDYQELQSAAIAQASNQLRLFGSGSNPVQQALAGVVCDNEAELGCNILTSRKRPREVDDLLAPQRRAQQLLNVADFHQSHGAAAAVMLPQSVGVSTGLKLAFEDERRNSSSTSTSGRPEGGSPFVSFLSDEVSAHLQQQRDEIDQYLRAQGEQVRQNLEEKRQRHSKALAVAIEERILKRLRDKDVEVEKLTRRNKDLEERFKQLTLEAHLWQKQAKNNEAMVTALRNNLQQAVALSREQSREGCGDSEADDAASSHYEDLADAHARAFRENKELKEQRTCRVCQCNDVSILLLPCRHLCLCKDCESRLDACPICRSIKNASVQVYMS
ncbi:hypothetical protein O6H91_19G009600 [Diphasiastrum complanatum]|uniref:Uncharacterized protein n=1 Tax=Diphasiastrum complanatum TaxID=34168 RepID=A0ACC2ASL2_DIPCM|nr:hypothetical protein O6H91_19G009600 [Diphasiastrum complanatum]